MKSFINLLYKLNDGNSSSNVVSALLKYFNRASTKEIIWAISLLKGNRPKRTITPPVLKKLACEQANIPTWLFEMSTKITKDIAETSALIIEKSTHVHSKKTLDQWCIILLELATFQQEMKLVKIIAIWDQTTAEECLLINKLLIGSFRTTIGQLELVEALSIFLKIEKHIIAVRFESDWSPHDESLESLFEKPNPKDHLAKPFPFCFANNFVKQTKKSIDILSFGVEYFRHGLRCQVIKRENSLYIWSKTGQLYTRSFPELLELKSLPFDFVIDGQIICSKENHISDFNRLESRINKKRPTKKILIDIPIMINVFDILEMEQKDFRSFSFEKRRQALNTVFIDIPVTMPMVLNELFYPSTMEECNLLLEKAKEVKAKGILLKNRTSPYLENRNDNWLKWRKDPFKLKTVLLYAQKMNRSSVYNHYSLAVMNKDLLIPIAKLEASLPKKNILEISKWIAKNIVDKFGPVRQVKPSIIINITFEDIAVSTRHKSGVILKSIKMVSWEKEENVEEISHLTEVISFV